MKTARLFDLSGTIARPLLEGCEYPWQALPKIGEFILECGKTLPKELYENPKEGVWISVKAVVAKTADINAPCIICAGAQVRHCAFIRGGAIVGEGCVVGNSTELKNAILFDGAQVPHYNYVGDSILGKGAHMGAGAITSNLKSDKSPVAVKGAETIETGLKKFGAILGDNVEVGCNSVLCPGSVVGKNSTIYPLSLVRGVVEENSIYKKAGEIAPKR